MKRKEKRRRKREEERKKGGMEKRREMEGAMDRLRQQNEILIEMEG